MAPFPRIVVGFDDSERALDALSLARRLAQPDCDELVLASIELPHGRHAEHRRDRIDLRRRETRLARPGHSVGRGLAMIAEECGAELIVVGSTRHGIDDRITPGRTARRLLQDGGCAVAQPPQGLRDEDPFRHVGVAFDGSPQAAAAVAVAYRLARRDEAAVSLFWALPSGDAARDKRDRHAADGGRVRAHELLDAVAETAPPGVNPRTVVLHGEPGAAIGAAADGVVDILFAGCRSHGVVKRAVEGSVSEALALEATQPLVVVPHGASRAPAPAWFARASRRRVGAPAAGVAEAL
jgi:nucleotide-binding universal stress UspA family protein